MAQTLWPATLSAQPTSAGNAFDVMKADPRFKTWTEILTRCGLQGYAQGKTTFTAFLPTEAAFKRYPDVQKEMLSFDAVIFPDTRAMIQLVRSHIVYGLHPTLDFEGDRLELLSLAGTKIAIVNSRPMTVTWVSYRGRTGTAVIQAKPVTATNAIIYPIDNPILVSTGELDACAGENGK